MHNPFFDQYCCIKIVFNVYVSKWSGGYDNIVFFFFLQVLQPGSELRFLGAKAGGFFYQDSSSTNLTKAAILRIEWFKTSYEDKVNGDKKVVKIIGFSRCLYCLKISSKWCQTWRILVAKNP